MAVSVAGMHASDYPTCFAIDIFSYYSIMLGMWNLQED
jgi:hypothetical protein